jgi:hypothetical protein
MKMFILGLFSRTEETEVDYRSYITDVDHGGSVPDCIVRLYVFPPTYQFASANS